MEKVQRNKMAHFAQINDNNVVEQVLVVDDRHAERGHDFLANDCGLGGRWIQTSYNTLAGVHLTGGTPLRKNFAGIGMIYDETRDAFYDPKPFESWILDEVTCTWNAPVEKPNDGKIYTWDENSHSWSELI